MGKKRKQEKKLTDDEKIQVWSDRILLVLSIILLLLAVIEFVVYQLV